MGTSNVGNTVWRDEIVVWFTFVWTGIALLALLVTPFVLQTTIPIFQIVWITIPLLDLIWFRDPERTGFRPVGLGRIVRMAVVAGLAYAALLVAVEPWTGIYDRLLELALEGPDLTFVWLVRFESPISWIGLALFSGFVTLYTEELFFRGWLLQTLKRRTDPRTAVVGQALLFTLLQSIPVLFFTPIRAAVYLLVYAFGLGVVVGTVAHRTESIWPGLLVVTIANLLLTVILV